MTDLEQIKAEYAKEFARTVPRLKSLSEQILKQERSLTDMAEIESFWKITSNPKLNYQLCQFALDIEESEQFWQSNRDRI